MEENGISAGFVIAVVVTAVCIAVLAVYIVTGLDWDAGTEYGMQEQAVTEVNDADEILREWKDGMREDADDGF